MFIWRIENENGNGPYVSNWVIIDVHESCGCPINMERHPTPHYDNLIDINQLSSNHSFGFKSKKQMKQWFHTVKIRNWLDDNGFLLVKYEIKNPNNIERYFPRVLKGEKQVAFMKKFATKVKTIQVCEA